MVSANQLMPGSYLHVMFVIGREGLSCVFGRLVLLARHRFIALGPVKKVFLLHEISVSMVCVLHE